jgi:hypothetical protein
MRLLVALLFSLLMWACIAIGLVGLWLKITH